MIWLHCSSYCCMGNIPWIRCGIKGSNIIFQAIWDTERRGKTFCFVIPRWRAAVPYTCFCAWWLDLQGLFCWKESQRDFYFPGGKNGAGAGLCQNHPDCCKSYQTPVNGGTCLKPSSSVCVATCSSGSYTKWFHDVRWAPDVSNSIWKILWMPICCTGTDVIFNVP